VLAADRLRLPLLRLPGDLRPKALVWELNQRLREAPRPDPAPVEIAGGRAQRADRDQLLHTLITGDPPPKARVLAWARESGVDLEAPRAVLAAAGARSPLNAVVGQLGGGVLAGPEGEFLALIVPAPAADAAALKALAAYWQQTLTSLSA